MIVAASMFVVSDNQKSLIPVRAVAQSVVNIMNQLFTERYVVIWMLTVSSGVPTRLQKSIGRQRAIRRCGLEIREKTKMTFIGIGRIWKLLLRERRIDVPVDRPTNIVLRQ